MKDYEFSSPGGEIASPGREVSLPLREAYRPVELAAAPAESAAVQEDARSGGRSEKESFVTVYKHAHGVTRAQAIRKISRTDPATSTIQ